MSSTNSVRVHVWPPSALRYTPRWPTLACRSPCAATSTTLGSLGSTSSDGICFELSRPMCRQVCPASTDLYIPSPSSMLPPEGKSPAPTDDTDVTASKMGSQVVPALVVFHRPPVGKPA